MELPHGTDLATWNGLDSPVHQKDKICSSDHGILSLIHGSRSGMVGFSLDGHQPLVNANNPFNDANVDLFLVKDSALLDVEFQERVEITSLAANGLKLVRLPAD